MLLALVALDHPNRPGRRGLDAQPAQDALVEVLLHDRHAAVVADRVDVDRADLRQLARQLGVRDDGGVDLDVDEHAVERLLRHQTAAFRLEIPSLTRSGMSSIRSATVIPASARRAIFSVAVSSLPSTIVPAWPKLIPGISSMKRPAMNA